MNIKILAIFTVILILGVGIYISNENNLNTGDQVYSPDLPDLKDGLVSNATAYQITDTTGLVNLSSLANAGNTFEGKIIFLANDLDLSGIEFVPIGNSSSSNQFKGTFDGQEYEISNLTITGDIVYAGLFGYIGSGGTVRNVALVSTEIVINADYGYVGGIAGYSYGTISNCCNSSGRVNFFPSNSSAYVGGIAGWNHNGTIQNCYNNADVYSSSSFTAQAGGIASNNVGTILNCYNTGLVFAHTSGESRSAYSGGIAGHSSSPIQNCYNTGSVLANTTYSTSGINLGGIVAIYTGSNTTNCYMLQTEGPGTTVTSDELKSASILAALGSAYIADKYSYNDGYPILTWQIPTRTISFDSQGGSSVSYQTVDDGQTTVMPDNPTKDNKVFWYWALNDEVFDFSTAIESDITLTAVWYDKLIFTSAPGGII